MPTEAPDYLEAVNSVAVRSADAVLVGVFPEIASWGTPAEIWLAESLDIPVTLWVPAGIIPPYYRRFAAFTSLETATAVIRETAYEHAARTDATETLWSIGTGIQAPQLAGDAGYDMTALESVGLAPGDHARIPLGANGTPLRVAIPVGTFCVPFVRSSWADRGLMVAPTVIEQYRGPLYAFAYNAGDEFLDIDAGERIAQLVFFDLRTPKLEVCDGPLPTSHRGDRGFGSTGK
jgi:dUTP pyrophosphatase